MFARTFTVMNTCFNQRTLSNTAMMTFRRNQLAIVPTMFRSFSNQQLNENEIIEYVEGKVFEVLKTAAKCKHEKIEFLASSKIQFVYTIFRKKVVLLFESTSWCGRVDGRPG